MVNLSSRIYDCPITPGRKRYKGFIENIDPVSLNWEEYFANIERHGDGSYLIIENEECSVIILKTGFYDILLAKNEEIVIKYINIIEEVVKNGISQ